MFDDILKVKGSDKVKAVNKNDFADVRTLMWYKICNDKGLWSTYQSNIAMYLYDNMVYKDIDIANDAAMDLMELIFA